MAVPNPCLRIIERLSRPPKIQQISVLSPLAWRGIVPILLLTTFAFLPGLKGDFVFDDIPNIVSKPPIQVSELSLAALIDATQAGHAGPLGRPIAYLSFALDHWRAGLDASAFKVTNLVIHLVNGLLVFALARLLLSGQSKRLGQHQRDAAALLTVALWLLHPLNLSPVLYVVQRMTSLAALFMFASALAYVHGRLRGGKAGLVWMLSAYVVFLPLAALAKENGLLLPTLLAALEYFLLRGRGDRGTRRLATGLHTVFFLLPTAALLLYTALRPEWITGGYVNRDFTLEQRLLTQARVLWSYVGLLFIPNVSQMGLYHEVALSTSLFEPWTTLPAVLGWAAVLTYIVWARRHQPLLAFAIAWYLLGHAMESTVIALELMHEHRTYLPNFGPLLALAVWLTRWMQADARWRRVLVAAIPLALAAATAVRAQVWGNTAVHMLVEAQNHPRAVSAQYEAGRTLFNYAQGLPEEKRLRTLQLARALFQSIATRSDGEAVVGLFPLLIAESTRDPPGDVEFLLEALRSALRERVQPAIVSDYLSAVGRCQHQGACRLSQEQVWSLFDAALGNPRLGGYRGSLVQIQAARYAWYARADYPTALRLASQAAETYPDNGCHRYDQIHMLDALGARDEARRMLAKARAAGLKGCLEDMTQIERRWQTTATLTQDHHPGGQGQDG